MISIDYTASFIILLLFSMSHLQLIHIELLRSVYCTFRAFFTALALPSTVGLLTELTRFFTAPINVTFLIYYGSAQVAKMIYQGLEGRQIFMNS